MQAALVGRSRASNASEAIARRIRKLAGGGLERRAAGVVGEWNRVL